MHLSTLFIVAATGFGCYQAIGLKLSIKRENERLSSLHRVKLSFDGGFVSGELICPEGGCKPATVCAHCGRHTDDPDDDFFPCYDCAAAFDSSCWVKSWFDNLSVEELLSGEVTVSIEASWRNDSLHARII